MKIYIILSQLTEKISLQQTSHTMECNIAHYECPKFTLLLPSTSFFLFKPWWPRTVPRSHIHLSSRDFKSSRLLLLSRTVTSTYFKASSMLSWWWSPKCQATPHTFFFLGILQLFYVSLWCTFNLQHTSLKLSTQPNKLKSLKLVSYIFVTY